MCNCFGLMTYVSVYNISWQFDFFCVIQNNKIWKKEKSNQTCLKNFKTKPFKPQQWLVTTEKHSHDVHFPGIFVQNVVELLPQFNKIGIGGREL